MVKSCSFDVGARTSIYGLDMGSNISHVTLFEGTNRSQIIFSGFADQGRFMETGMTEMAGKQDQTG